VEEMKITSKSTSCKNVNSDDDGNRLAHGSITNKQPLTGQRLSISITLLCVKYFIISELLVIKLKGLNYIDL